MLAYGAGAWLVFVAAGWVADVLALPRLFDTLLRWGLVVGAGMAALVAWRFPQIGDGGHRPGDAGPP